MALILKKSNIASKVPSINDLNWGELAINYTDGKLYYKRQDGSDVGSIDSFLAVATNGKSLGNKIINGKMEIAQRGTSFSFGALTSGYTLDRWQFAHSSSAQYTVTQNTSAIQNFERNLRVQVVTSADTSISSTDYALVQQVIEGFNITDLFGATFTISFWVTSSKVGTHCLYLRNNGAAGNPDRSYIATYTVNVANTPEYKTITVTGGLPTSGTWNRQNGAGLYLGWILAAGSAYQTTAGAWQTGNFIGTSAQVNCLDTVGNIFAITGVQLEVGSAATPFEHRPIGAELALCQRYYEVVTAETNGIIAVGQALSSNYVIFNIKFSATKRAVPTGLSSGSFIALTSIGGSAGGTLEFSVLSINSARLNIQSASGLTAGNASGVFATGAPASVAFSAEL